MQSGEWTEVTTKGKRRKREPIVLEVKPRNPPSRTVNLAKVQADFNGKMKFWHACQCRKTTLATLDRIQPNDGWEIRQAICMGSGSFSRDNMECRKRSMWQFVVFVDLVRELQRRTKSKVDVEMFAQEPEFTDVDKSLLETLGVKTLEVAKPMKNADITRTTSATAVGLGPAREHLDSGTFLYEPFMDMNAQMVREILDADPVLYIGSSMRGLLARRGEVGDLAKRFDQDHEKYQLPRFEEDPNVLEGLGLYWKAETDDCD